MEPATVSCHFQKIPLQAKSAEEAFQEADGRLTLPVGTPCSGLLGCKHCPSESRVVSRHDQSAKVARPKEKTADSSAVRKAS